MTILSPKSKQKLPPNASPLPPELWEGIPENSEALPASARVPVLPPQLSSFLLRSSLLLGVVMVFQLVGFVALLFIATKPAPDLVQQDNGVLTRVRPLERRVDSLPNQVVGFLEDRLPRLYTWSGLLIDSSDPTGLSYIKDPGVPVKTKKGETVLIPTTLYNEQFIFDEPLRDTMIAAIAAVIQDGSVDQEIFQNEPAHPSLAIVYRFVLRGKIQYPQEVSTNRWRVRVAADIIRFSPTATLGMKEKPMAEFVQDIYVRKSSPIPQLFIHEQKLQDLVWYGRKDGFVIDAMVPVGPAQEVPGVPRN